MSCSTGAAIDGDGPDRRIGMEKSFSHVLRATITDACPAVAASGKRRLAARLWNDVTGPAAALIFIRPGGPTGRSSARNGSPRMRFTSALLSA
jgi:hypothetical protein